MALSHPEMAQAPDAPGKRVWLLPLRGRTEHHRRLLARLHRIRRVLAPKGGVSIFVIDGQLYIVEDGGFLASLDARSGELVRRDRVPGGGNYYSSPVAGDGKIYLVDERGRLSVVRAGREWRVLSAGNFEEDVYATPALADGRIYVRTSGHLYCFGLPEKK